MKKIIELIKRIFAVTKTVTPEQKQEINKIATDVVKALDEVKEKKEKKHVATNPAAVAGGMQPLESAPAAPKKKKRYYKPKAPKA